LNPLPGGLAAECGLISGQAAGIPAIKATTPGLHHVAFAEMDLIKQMADKSVLWAEFPPTPYPDHCFLRRPGEPGVDYDPRYVANARQAVETFIQFLSANEKISKDAPK
jgi:hypothetical protein